MNPKELIEKEASLAEFLKVFVRQHYMLMDGQEKVQISPHFQEVMEQAQRELEALSVLTDKEKEERTAAFNKSLREHDEEDVGRERVNEKSVERMLELIWAWEPDQSELRNIRVAASDFVGKTPSLTPLEVIPEMTPDEWLAEQLELANRRLQWTIRCYGEAVEDVERANEALEAIGALNADI